MAMTEDKGKEIMNEIDGIIGNLEETKVTADKGNYCFEYRANLCIQIIEKAMLTINYIRENKYYES